MPSANLLLYFQVSSVYFVPQTCDVFSCILISLSSERPINCTIFYDSNRSRLLHKVDSAVT
jgi:hypothetical protein